jgi:hypothetical protein
MTATSPDITFCLKRIGKDTAGWDTLVVTGTADTVTPPEDLWAAWSDLERWPLWSPLHRSVTGTPEAALAAGASFDQQISLGSVRNARRPPVTTLSRPGCGWPGTPGWPA